MRRSTLARGCWSYSTTMTRTGEPVSSSVFNQWLIAELDALYRTARYLTGQPALAENIVQEVALKAIRARQTFRPEMAFRPWLFAILRNTLTDHYRRQQTHPPMVSLDEGEFVASPERVEARLLDSVLDEEIEQALATLPETMRLAVLLADIEAFSYQEIATALDWPLGTVMSRLHRGRQKLRQALLAYARRRGYEP